ncbi:MULTISPECIES: peptide chain release factor N(5)-glutamine methyltransferase [Tatumella]|uniref:Release factor glutamine methyltransferase n=1 Tax=Tatumella punctata TaxID=399969 RepID=A0ABW1VQK1_9GAMM|nr:MULTISPECIES: peptide chain release factor N(5)-glutamine methyltransferase [unclassified Tatumella]MBS0876021.1 peptide chain release factor N(5)-glutamine methyltransferase [Tatumella sp. JGM82]MBS0890495.1 peptide chain release factor N(5)-glutamine methyltransferase [Tatumella sp. JGM94]MBS0900951.1 peptide chain release factor N(5)-glutamine methyltransferase [Tatumella sp. JGM100]
MRIRDWLAQSRVVLQHSESPKRDAEVLLGYVLAKPRSWLIAFDDTSLSPAQLTRLTMLLERRRAGEPVAHLLGEREFWSLPLKVNNSTLIPRPDTEVLVEVALQLLGASPAAVLDLGTGSGAVALAIAKERPDCEITGVDRVPEAVALARENAALLALSGCRFLQSDWFSELSGAKYQLIVSNPPYIDATDRHLQQGDVRFEPLSALVADEGGLADLRKIADQSRDWLQKGGWLAMEHGWQQADAVSRLLTDAGYQQVATQADYGGNPRVTFGQYNPGQMAG